MALSSWIQDNCRFAAAPAAPAATIPPAIFEGFSSYEAKLVRMDALKTIRQMRGLPPLTKIPIDQEYIKAVSERAVEFRAHKEKMRKLRAGEDAWHTLPTPSGKIEQPAVFPITRPSGQLSKSEAINLMRQVAGWFSSQGKTNVEEAYTSWYQLMTSGFFDKNVSQFYENYIGSSSPLMAIWNMSGGLISGTLKQKTFRLKFFQRILRLMRDKGMVGVNGHPIPSEDQWPGIPRWFVNPAKDGLTRKLMAKFMAEGAPLSRTENAQPKSV